MKLKLIKDIIINHTFYLQNNFATSSEQVVLITCYKIKINKSKQDIENVYRMIIFIHIFLIIQYKLYKASIYRLQIVHEKSPK
jgi:hypothetical protein